MRGNNTFKQNYCDFDYDDSNNVCQGGAIFMDSAQLIVQGNEDFIANRASTGGAIFTVTSEVHLHGSLTVSSNCAHKGGGLYIYLRSVITTAGHINFSSNRAKSLGGAMYIEYSNATFDGNTLINSNTGEVGGGIAAQNSFVVFQDSCKFSNNTALYAGALNTIYGVVHFQGSTQFAHNTADKDGGALYATGTTIEIKERVNFINNSADNGGAMYFESGTSLNLLTEDCFITQISSSFNSARQYGGLIHYQDSATQRQCDYLHHAEENTMMLPYCFLQTLLKPYYQDCSLIDSNYDSAGLNGTVIYGGLLDRCRMKIPPPFFTAMEFIRQGLIKFNSLSKHTVITSAPYELCICDEGKCFKKVAEKVYRGQKFTVPLLGEAQVGTCHTTVTSKTSATAKLETYQTSQLLPDYCHPLPYTVYSTESHEQVVLYPDGPCRDTGTARVVIDVTLLPCPDGFTQSGEICTCDNRLHDYPINCTIAETPYLTKTADSNFWIGVSYYANTTMSYQGLILCKSCPAEYCKKGDINVTIDNPDMQCDLDRSGLLCGACATNHSLMLGSSQCQICPNTYLALLLPFAAAGVALVVFLTCLRLTVATGTLNSIILYANILQVNRILFFPQNTRNLLTVFLAWLNLDLGFETCFYDGLDAFALTWLQFAFPLYVWLIICLIIFISRYSIIVSKLIGSNPIAVLATLLLMSYTKILKIIIEVYSYDVLDYPEGNKTTTVSVWLKDANVPYLKSNHLFLTVVTTCVLIFIFLPYTLFLLLGYKLYRFTGRKHWCWLNRLKPLLDSYYAPYKNNTRYWTGFLLLVRCALYIIFSLSSTSRNLLTITLMFSAIEFTVSYFHSGRIYKNMLVNFIETSIYLNLIVLSATTLTGLNAAALVYSLVGLVFVIMIALSAYQFHLLYIAKTTLWLRLKNKCPRFRKKLSEEQITPPNTINPSHDPHKIVTKTVIDLREPLLES